MGRTGISLNRGEIVMSNAYSFMTDRAKLTRAYSKLRSRDYYANLLVSEHQNPKRVFLQYELKDVFDTDGNAKMHSYLKWQGDADEILEVLHSCDISAVWSGSAFDCIGIF